jgi:hypothetical protein
MHVHDQIVDLHPDHHPVPTRRHGVIQSVRITSLKEIRNWPDLRHIPLTSKVRGIASTGNIGGFATTTLGVLHHNSRCTTPQFRCATPKRWTLAPKAYTFDMGQTTLKNSRRFFMQGLAGSIIFPIKRVPSKILRSATLPQTRQFAPGRRREGRENSVRGSFHCTPTTRPQATSCTSGRLVDERWG